LFNITFGGGGGPGGPAQAAARQTMTEVKRRSAVILKIMLFIITPFIKALSINISP
jgi:hypothetical protein